MNETDYIGYKNNALNVLKSFQAKVWSEVTVFTIDDEFSGILIPKPESLKSENIIIKLKNGYQVGISPDRVVEIRVDGKKKEQVNFSSIKFPYDASKPTIKLLGTGGTIASKYDYTTGSAVPAFSPDDLYASVPELGKICNLQTEQICSILSENMGPEHWMKLAHSIEVEIKKGIDGIVISHGTDTMQFTASALSFMIQNSPIPIVMVGSQRSSDRPSSDAAINLINATKTAATSDIAEVMICMFGPTSDQYCLLHRGTRVRKMHTSYRSTFRSIGVTPLAMVSDTKITTFTKEYNHRRTDRKVSLFPGFDEKVFLLHSFPTLNEDMFESIINNNYKGIIIAGTGLGHVNRRLYEVIKKAINKGIIVCMTPQCLWGYVQMYVYETGREIMNLGVIPLANMLPETAYVKLGWVLSQTSDPEEAKKLMVTPIACEITEKEPHNGYLVYQGGIPEVEEYLSKHKR